jgi:hypothetical protein
MLSVVVGRSASPQRGTPARVWVGDRPGTAASGSWEAGVSQREAESWNESLVAVLDRALGRAYHSDPLYYAELFEVRKGIEAARAAADADAPSWRDRERETSQKRRGLVA